MAILVIGCVVAIVPIVVWVTVVLRRRTDGLPPSGLPSDWWKRFERELEDYTSRRT
jgi:hypothetical protein